MNDTKKKKVSDLFKDLLPKLAILGILVIYIIQGMFAIQKKDTSLWDILGSIALSIIVGVVVSSMLSNLGLKDGRRSDIFIASMKSYGETKSKATKYFDKLAAWCEYKNAFELEARRKEIIQNAGLKWKLYKVGYYNEHKPKDDDQIRAIEHASKCKIDRLLPQDLLSDLPKSKYDKRRFGVSENEYRAKNTIVDAITKVAIGVICGLYTIVPIIDGDSWATILWNILQVAMWLAFGIIKYMNSKSFIEDEYRQTHIILKTEYLNEFIITCEKNMAVIDNYDDDDEFEEFIQKYRNAVNEENTNNSNNDPTANNSNEQSAILVSLNKDNEPLGEKEDDKGKEDTNN